MMNIYDPTDPMGYMPEIPQEQLKDMTDEDFHFIGCLYPLAAMVVIAIGLLIAALVCWIF